VPQEQLLAASSTGSLGVEWLETALQYSPQLQDPFPWKSLTRICHEKRRASWPSTEETCLRLIASAASRGSLRRQIAMHSLSDEMLQQPGASE
jgi:hypothetical protein